jgi:hypothetical protein
MPPKVPALPRNEIEPRLSIAGFSAQDICVLLRPDEWCALESRNQQVVLLYDFARNECSMSLPAAIIGQVFEIPEALDLMHSAVFRSLTSNAVQVDIFGTNSAVSNGTQLLILSKSQNRLSADG